MVDKIKNIKNKYLINKWFKKNKQMMNGKIYPMKMIWMMNLSKKK